ncbi:hypothetical protein TKK_0003623 [Trichogramma kaykai]
MSVVNFKRQEITDLMHTTIWEIVMTLSSRLRDMVALKRADWFLLFTGRCVFVELGVVAEVQRLVLCCAVGRTGPSTACLVWDAIW